MQLDCEQVSGLLILSIGDNRLDAAGAVTFKEAARKMIEGHGGRVLVDMSRVEFLDSSGLGALVAVMKAVANGKLEICGAGAIVIKVLQLTRMDTVFVLHDSRDSALAARNAA